MTASLSQVGFVALAALLIASAVIAVTGRNLFRAALALGLSFVAVAGLFLLLHAEFLAWAHLLIYVGAILVLIVFAIMVTGKAQADLPSFGRGYRLLAAGLCGGLFVVLTGTLVSAPWPQRFAEKEITTAALGQQLVRTFVLPFEVFSLVVIAALIGGVVLAAHFEESDHS